MVHERKYENVVHQKKADMGYINLPTKSGYIILDLIYHREHGIWTKQQKQGIPINTQNRGISLHYLQWSVGTTDSAQSLKGTQGAQFLHPL